MRVPGSSPLVLLGGTGTETSVRRGALPVELTTFVGRQAEIEELAGLVGASRLVTITGIGGGGKTRLAREVVASTAARYGDGVGWIDLAPVAGPDRVGEVAAEAMGVLVGPGSDPLSALAARLGGQEVLIAIDNCEHLLDACGALVEHVLRTCPGVTILATSREPLGVAGEAVWRTPPMGDGDGMALFAERARSARFDFAVSADNEAEVRELCRRLDGIPLAVELAAAWVRTLSPAQIAGALDDRFRILVGGPRGATARHQTLLASVEWSHDLLGDDARVLLRRLAVFAGGFSLEAAEEVCGDDVLPPERVLATLGRLTDTSMVVATDCGTVVRYRLPETIRDFAADRLAESGETDAVRDRHVACFLAMAERAAAAFDHEDHDAVLRDLETEHENLRAALHRGRAAGDPRSARRLCAALMRLWFLHGHACEGIEATQWAIDVLPDDRSNLQAELLAGLATLAMPAGRMALSAEASSRAMAIATSNGDHRTLARANAAAAYVPFYSDYRRSEDVARSARRHGEAAGDTFAVELGLLFEVVSLGNRDRYDEALPLADELLAWCSPRNARFGAAISRSVAMYGAVHCGDVRRALQLGSSAMQLARPLGDYFITGTVTSNLAWACGVAGEVERGRELLDALIRSIDSAGPDVDVVDLRVNFGKLLLWSGEVEPAVEWLQKASNFTSPGPDNWSAMRALPSLAAGLRHLGRSDAAFEAAERGAAMARRLHTPHALAESLDELGHLHIADDPDRAATLYHESLALRVAHRLRTHVASSLDALGHVAALREDHDHAARLLAASDAARAGSGYPRPLLDQAHHTAVVTRMRTALGDRVAEAAQAEGARLTLDQAVAYATRNRGRRGSRPSSGWASLTPTELAVVAHAAEGLTNPQIAERLFVSRATVKTHLNHVYSKLGVGTRAELAVLAARHLGTERGSRRR